MFLDEHLKDFTAVIMFMTWRVNGQSEQETIQFVSLLKQKRYLKIEKLSHCLDVPNISIITLT